jgi:hypothetical protein
LAQFSELKIRLIAIGGTSLVLRGIKTTSMNLDFVAENESNYKRFLDYSVKQGYKAKAYSEERTILTGPIVIEIFLEQVQGLRINERMVSRCSKDPLKF